MITFGSRPWEATVTTLTTLCDNEYSLLESFGFGGHVAPEVITGWNVDPFGHYLPVTVFLGVLGEKHTNRLSPWGLVSSREIEQFGRKQIKYEIAGVSIPDYLDIYKKFTYTTRESYRLTAQIEPASRNWTTRSSIRSKIFTLTAGISSWTITLLTPIIDRLEEKMKLIDLAMLVARICSRQPH